jgi:hypothetical protein
LNEVLVSVHFLLSDKNYLQVSENLIPWFRLCLSVMDFCVSAIPDWRRRGVRHRSGYFGMRDYARLFGVYLGLVTAGAAAAPLLFALLFLISDSHASSSPAS